MTDYTYDVQKIIPRNDNARCRKAICVCKTFFNVENFDRDLREVAEFISDHVDKHKTLPERSQLKAVTGTNLQEIPDLNEGHTDWFLSEFESFTKRSELETCYSQKCGLAGKRRLWPS